MGRQSGGQERAHQTTAPRRCSFATTAASFNEYGGRRLFAFRFRDSKKAIRPSSSGSVGSTVYDTRVARERVRPCSPCVPQPRADPVDGGGEGVVERVGALSRALAA